MQPAKHHLEEIQRTSWDSQDTKEQGKQSNIHPIFNINWFAGFLSIKINQWSSCYLVFCAFVKCKELLRYSWRFAILILCLLAFDFQVLQSVICIDWGLNQWKSSCQETSLINLTSCSLQMILPPKVNGWNLKITQVFKRKSSEPNLHLLCSILIFLPLGSSLFSPYPNSPRSSESLTLTMHR